jgi:hypothetical protein
MSEPMAPLRSLPVLVALLCGAAVACFSALTVLLAHRAARAVPALRPSSEIWVAGVHGGEPRLVVSEPGQDDAPRFAGDLVVYDRVTNPLLGLVRPFAVGADGSRRAVGPVRHGFGAPTATNGHVHLATRTIRTQLGYLRDEVIVDAGTSTRAYRLPGAGNAIGDVAVDPAGAHAAVTERGALLLLDLSTGRTRRLGAAPSLAGPAFSPDGKLLAYGTMAGSVRIIDLATGRAWIAVPRGWQASFSLDGRSLVYLRVKVAHTIPK